MRIFCSYIHIANRVEIRSIENIDIPFGNELVSFHACLEKKKKKNSSKIGTSLPRGKFSLRFHPSQPSFYIYLYIIPERSESKYQSKRKNFLHILHVYPWILSSLFFLEFFLFIHLDRVPDLEYDRLRFIKRFPPPEKNPSSLSEQRGCSLINNPLSFFSFFHSYRPRAEFSSPRSSFYPPFFLLSLLVAKERHNTWPRRGIVTRDTGPINTEIHPPRNGFHARSQLFRIACLNDNALIPRRKIHRRVAFVWNTIHVIFTWWLTRVTLSMWIQMLKVYNWGWVIEGGSYYWIFSNRDIFVIKVSFYFKICLIWFLRSEYRRHADCLSTGGPGRF